MRKNLDLSWAAFSSWHWNTQGAQLVGVAGVASQTSSQVYMQSVFHSDSKWGFHVHCFHVVWSFRFAAMWHCVDESKHHVAYLFGAGFSQSLFQTVFFFFHPLSQAIMFRSVRVCIENKPSDIDQPCVMGFEAAIVGSWGNMTTKLKRSNHTAFCSTVYMI